MEPALMMQTATGLLAASAAGGGNGSHTIQRQTTSAHLARDAARIFIGRRVDLVDLCVFYGRIAQDGATGTFVVLRRGCGRRFQESKFSLENAADTEMIGSCWFTPALQSSDSCYWSSPRGWCLMRNPW